MDRKKKLNEIDNFTEDGSGWVFISIVHLKIYTVKDEPMGGSSYIPLPKYLAKKEAIVSLKNNDDQCFKWAISRAIHPAERNLQRIDKKLESKSRLT